MYSSGNIKGVSKSKIIRLAGHIMRMVDWSPRSAFMWTPERKRTLGVPRR